ncbi:MAG TPA: protein-methionine-sulfoxide reductase heme-binding subunit MsrQ [Roseiflexaceae bacterium]|nr:protein-methionine-sulfoxide reductase heme-binding subunit MsrQ [Roseiflexaceae bacterium]
MDDTLAREATPDQQGASTSNSKLKTQNSKLLAIRLAAHAGALVPLAAMVWAFFTGGLSANPIQDLTFRTGEAALVLLVLSLACTPVNRLLGWKPAQALRRPLGLYAFFYAALHLLVFVVLDYGLDWSLILATVAEKRYVIAGFAAFLLLLPLAVTSTKGWQRRLGKRWSLLHRLVYLAAPLAVLHFALLVKADLREPLLFGAALALLLATRLPPVRRALARLRGTP